MAKVAMNMTLDEVTQSLERILAAGDDELRTAATAQAAALLQIGEAILECWVEAQGEAPTGKLKEGFRLLALQRQGAKADPSFNACRETCREIAYHDNLLALPAPPGQGEQRLKMMGMLVRHLALFVGGKMQVEGLGEFCCASRPMRTQSDAPPQ